MERIAIPKKGRVYEQVFNLLLNAGFKLKKRERLDFCVCDALGIEVYFLPAKDIPNAVASRAIQFGITGIDLIEDAHVKVDTHLKLGIGKARMVLATPEKSKYQGPESLEGKKIGTTYPRLTKKFLSKLGVKKFDLVYFAGSVEIQVKLGVVDAIVDITETGTSLRANQLVEREQMLQSEMVLISSAGHQSEVLTRMIKRIQRVMRGRSHVLLKFNLPENLLDKACSLSNGLSSPTVNQLADSGWLALEVAVPGADVHLLMDQLHDLGAKGILSSQLSLCSTD